jgi:AGCS family alanine or glycine:cation symporter
VIASSGVLGMSGADGVPYQGVALTMAAFSTYLGPVGGYIISIGIVLFAFSTIIGWEYHGEKAFEYICSNRRAIMVYRVLFALVAFIGATQTLDIVWSISDIANALMAIPNLLSLLLLSGVVFEEVKRFEAEKREAVEGSASEEDNSKEQAAKKQDTDETRTVEIDGLEI